MAKLKAALLAHQSRPTRSLSSRKVSTTPSHLSPKAKKARKKARQRLARTADVPAHQDPAADDTLRRDKGKGRATAPFNEHDTVLLLGEANFSFARSVVEAHGHEALRVCATSYDTEEVGPSILYRWPACSVTLRSTAVVQGA